MQQLQPEATYEKGHIWIRHSFPWPWQSWQFDDFDFSPASAINLLHNSFRPALVSQLFFRKKLFTWLFSVQRSNLTFRYITPSSLFNFENLQTLRKDFFAAHILSTYVALAFWYPVQHNICTILARIKILVTAALFPQMLCKNFYLIAPAQGTSLCSLG